MSRIYIGNLSNEATEREVHKFFRKHGPCSNIVLKNGYGFIDFDRRSDADSAIEGLNQKELCGDRVFLELSKGANKMRRGLGNRGGSRFHHNNNNFGHFSRSSNFNKPFGGPPIRTDYRVIVDNLSSQASWQDLKDLARHVGDVMFTDAHTQAKNRGLVEFRSREDVEAAMRKLNGYEFFGRRLKIREEKTLNYGRNRHLSRDSRSYSGGSRSSSPGGGGGAAGDGGQRGGRSNSSVGSGSAAGSNKRSRSRSHTWTPTPPRRFAPPPTHSRKDRDCDRDRVRAHYSHSRSRSPVNTAKETTTTAAATTSTLSSLNRTTKTATTASGATQHHRNRIDSAHGHAYGHGHSHTYTQEHEEEARLPGSAVPGTARAMMRSSRERSRSQSPYSSRGSRSQSRSVSPNRSRSGSHRISASRNNHPSVAGTERAAAAGNAERAVGEAASRAAIRRQSASRSASVNSAKSYRSRSHSRSVSRSASRSRSGSACNSATNYKQFNQHAVTSEQQRHHHQKAGTVTANQDSQANQQHSKQHSEATNNLFTANSSNNKSFCVRGEETRNSDSTLAETPAGKTVTSSDAIGTKSEKEGEHWSIGKEKSVVETAANVAMDNNEENRMVIIDEDDADEASNSEADDKGEDSDSVASSRTENESSAI